jgi:hypothetical protein
LRGVLVLCMETHLLAQELQTILLTWPFETWGLNLLGPFRKALGGYTHLLVTIDKFTNGSKQIL